MIWQLTTLINGRIVDECVQPSKEKALSVRDDILRNLPVYSVDDIRTVAFVVKQVPGKWHKTSSGTAENWTFPVRKNYKGKE